MSGIFISYRRQDSSYIAGRLHDRLAAHFGPGQIFRDIDTMKPGVDFGRRIDEAVGSCDALLVVIGDGWLDARSPQGERRIDAPKDWVRQEIQVALERPDVLVVPVLVENAAMPSEDELPPAIRELANRNAMELSDRRWDYEVQRLIEALEEVVRQPADERPAPGPAPIQDPRPLVAPVPVPPPSTPRPQWSAPPGGADLSPPPPAPHRSTAPAWLTVGVPLLVLAVAVAVAVAVVLVRSGGSGGSGGNDEAGGNGGSTTIGTVGRTTIGLRTTTSLPITATTRVLTGPFTGKSGAVTLTVQKVEIATSRMRVHLLVVNGTGDALTLPAPELSAIDDTGRSYKVDPFSKEWPAAIPAGQRVSGVVDISEPPQRGAATMRVGWSRVFGTFAIRSIFVDKVRLT